MGLCVEGPHTDTHPQRPDLLAAAFVLDDGVEFVEVEVAKAERGCALELSPWWAVGGEGGEAICENPAAGGRHCLLRDLSDLASC